MTFSIIYQFGFRLRQLHSTNHAVITLVEKITTALYKDKIMVG